jgi:hypothetical protein
MCRPSLFPSGPSLLSPLFSPYGSLPSASRYGRPVPLPALPVVLPAGPCSCLLAFGVTGACTSPLLSPYGSLLSAARPPPIYDRHRVASVRCAVLRLASFQRQPARVNCFPAHRLRLRLRRAGRLCLRSGTRCLRCPRLQDLTASPLFAARCGSRHFHASLASPACPAHRLCLRLRRAGRLCLRSGTRCLRPLFGAASRSPLSAPCSPSTCGGEDSFFLSGRISPTSDSPESFSLLSPLLSFPLAPLGWTTLFPSYNTSWLEFARR